MKTPAALLADAENIIRQKNAENTTLRAENARIHKDNDTAETIRREIFNIADRSPEPPDWIVKPMFKSGKKEVPMTIWSDWHYGEVVDPDEVGGVNAFNADIAKKRIKTLVDSTVGLVKDHHGKALYPGAVVMLGGDMIGGDIHEELQDTNDRTPPQAINDLTDILAGAIETMATEFGRLFIPCVVGNHGRGTKKPRNKARIFTSLEWLIYCNLVRHFKKSEHIRFLVSNEADAYFEVFGHRYLLTHGDSLGTKGGDGIIGAAGPILRGIMKVGRSNATIGRNFDTVVMGHWHQYISFPGLIVNNSLMGLNEYAHLQLRAPNTRPSQALWGCHPDYGITWTREVFLEKKKVSQNEKVWVSWQT